MDINLLVNLVAQDVKPNAIALATGLTEERVGQILSHKAFQTAVTEAKFKLLEQQTQMQKTEVDLEETVLDRLKDLAAYADITELTQLLKVVKTAGSKVDNKNKGESKVVINFRLPTASRERLLKPAAHHNDNTEVVSVEDMSLAPMNSDQLESLILELA